MGVRGLVEQFLKFGVVGVVATLIDYGLLMVLSQVVGWDPVASSAISFSVSLVFNYLASMRYVFERKEDLSRRREFLIFAVLSLIGLALNALIMWAGTRAFGDGALSVTVTKAVATAIVMVWNFASRKRWLEAH